MNQQLLDKWIALASEDPQIIAFPEATEEKILQAVREVSDLNVVKAILVGDPDEINAAANNYNISLFGIAIVSNTKEAVTGYAQQYCKTRSVMSVNSIIRKSKDPMFFSFILQALGVVGGVFAGISHTTGDVMLTAKMLLGMENGISVVSSMGLMDIPGYQGENGTLIAFADSAVCIDPTAEELADIAISTCETVKTLLEWEPRCALLSFSTDGSSEHPKIEKVIRAVKIANDKRPDLMIDGEFQLDAAICARVAEKKMHRKSDVAGRANVLIWPDLSVGNIVVKSVQQFAKGDAYGPIIQGLSRPISDCSRSAPVSELVGNIISLGIRVQSMERL